MEVRRDGVGSPTSTASRDRRADRRRLGRRAGPEGRLRRLHAEGDPRATLARSATRSWDGSTRRAARAGRTAHHRRRSPRGPQGVRGRVRHRLPRGSRGQVRDRALDTASGRDRDRLRVPLSRPRAGSAHADACRAPVGRDDRHARSGAACAAPRFTVSPSRTRWVRRSRERPTACCTRTPAPRSASPRPRRSPRRWSRSIWWRCTWRRSAERCSRRDRRGVGAPGRAAGTGRAGDSSSSRRCARSPSGTATPATVLFIGRHTGYPAALEGALKLKEISYIHAEGFPAAELKHGPIALSRRACPSSRWRPNATSTRRCSRTSRRSERAAPRSSRSRRRATPRPEPSPSTCSRCRETPELLLTGRGDGSAAAARLSRRQAPRLRRRPAPEPGQERHGRIASPSTRARCRLACASWRSSVSESTYARSPAWSARYRSPPHHARARLHRRGARLLRRQGAAGRILRGRFAAREAVIKALGGYRGKRWQDISVARHPSGAPCIVLAGNAKRRADALGVDPGADHLHAREDERGRVRESAVTVR